MMQKQRLLKLANYLQNAPINPKQFKLWSFADRGFEKREKYAAGCGLAYATRDVFRRSKLKLVNCNTFPYTSEMDLKYGDCKGLDAACKFFGINQDQAYYLFTDFHYRYGRGGPKTMGKRIQRFVENGGKLPRGFTKEVWL